jgi:hypothetical protein
MSSPSAVLGLQSPYIFSIADDLHVEKPSKFIRLMEEVESRVWWFQ